MMMRLGACVLMAAALLMMTACGSATRSAEANDASGSAPIYAFQLELVDDGDPDRPLVVGAFTGVDGLQAEIEVIEFQDGQDPNLRRKLPGRTKYGDITLKKGYLADTNAIDDWWKSIRDGQFESRDGAIVVMDDMGTQVDRYQLFNCWPSKWKGFTLDGKGTDVAVEEITLVVERIDRAKFP